jgi:hypothetical protein
VASQGADGRADDLVKRLLDATVGSLPSLRDDVAVLALRSTG